MGRGAGDRFLQSRGSASEHLGQGAVLLQTDVGVHAEDCWPIGGGGRLGELGGSWGPGGEQVK